MSFSTMNGINSSRMSGGLGGTRRAPLAQAPPAPSQTAAPDQGWNSQGNQQQAPAGPGGWNTHQAGGGLNGPPMAQNAQAIGGGMMGSSPVNNRMGMAATQVPGAMGQMKENVRQQTGVAIGQAGPQLRGPAPVQFDPNDPRNAALAGYMHGA